MIRKDKKIPARADMATKALPHTSDTEAAPTSSGIRKRALRPKNMPAKASPSFTSASEEAPPWLKRSNETPSSATYALSPDHHVSDQNATTPSGVSKYFKAGYRFFVLINITNTNIKIKKKRQPYLRGCPCACKRNRSSVRQYKFTTEKDKSQLLKA
jgi:hypothetical protein